MREREQEILLFAVNARYTDALPSRMNFPHDFIKALSQVVLDQEKRIADLEARCTPQS